MAGCGGRPSSCSAGLIGPAYGCERSRAGCGLRPGCCGPARQSRSTSRPHQPAIAAQATVRTIAVTSAATLGSLGSRPASHAAPRRDGRSVPAPLRTDRRAVPAPLRTDHRAVPAPLRTDRRSRPRAGQTRLCRMATGSLTVAATAVASGVPVSLWLTGEATLLALPGQADDFRLAYASPLVDLLAAILKEGSVTVCTQCAARREITANDLIDGIKIAGASTFLAEVMADGAKALVYLASCLQQDAT